MQISGFPFARFGALLTLIGIAACSSPTDPAGALVIVSTETEISDVHLPLRDKDVLSVSVTVRNTGSRGIKVPADPCPVPVEVRLYTDEARTGESFEPVSVSKVCTFALYAPQVLAPGQAKEYYSYFEIPPAGIYYGRASLSINQDTLHADFGPFVVEQPNS